MKASIPDGFAVAHAHDAHWEGGLRSFFAYRDLGAAASTGGRVGAHVIRATGAQHVPQPRHHHTLEFQLVYILKGWIEFDYAEVGRVRLEAGSSVVQPPGIGHAELAHSADLEMLEIVLPAAFATGLE